MSVYFNPEVETMSLKKTQNVNTYIDDLFSQCNRIVITARHQFNPKNKKSIEALVDIKDPGDIELAKPLFRVELDGQEPGWMSPVDIYINFMRDKSLIDSIGIVLDSWLRNDQWDGDYPLKNHQDFHRWLDGLLVT